MDAFPNDPSEYVDTDNDGLGNNADADDDGDGFSDSDEAYAGTDPLDNGDYPMMNTARSVEVSWETPTSREDGSSLYAYEIQGYEVKYRNVNDGEYSSVLLTLDPSELITSTTLDLNSAGTYEFTVAVYDVNGLYSDFSQPVQVSIQ
ncbi:fibronectin type III domain-containing protein [Gynuella sunshinyii]|uniref:Fibronectin type-III domain-containing protein n=1 Tax=Gynuella sunshinyii YC6258 TaxID=1445510 RepID=A0A0C5VJR3_9GAMM|nr:fibronectin type III domain-containing protein [Gynuella sunshinyii]AJQ94902.1 hypothetical Protein YC6258_02864 [Gynuella sunshinyii YC6258]